MTDGAVTLDTVDGIATLTLRRPGSLNAMSAEMMGALDLRLDELDRIPDLRVVIVTGEGRAFSAGGDLKGFEEALHQGGTTLVDMLRYNQDVLQRVEDIAVPVIGAANGAAIAGGLELLLCCDIILAAEGARLGDGHARYGIVPAGGATVRLRERLSPSRAAQLFYTAASYDAATLAAWGLVNEVVPGDRLLQRAEELAAEISQNSPQAIRQIKALTGRPFSAEARSEQFRMEIDRWAAHVRGSDLPEGLRAFKARQRPDFRTAKTPNG